MFKFYLMKEADKNSENLCNFATKIYSCGQIQCKSCRFDSLFSSTHIFICGVRSQSNSEKITFASSM